MNTITIGLFERISTTEAQDPIAVNIRKQKAKERANKLRWRLQMAYRGRKIIDLREFILISNSCTKQLFCRIQINSMIANGDTGGFNPEIIHVVGGTVSNPGIGGEAIGKSSLVIRGGSIISSWHEIMHTLRGTHSWDWNTQKEYGGNDMLAITDIRPNALSLIELGLSFPETSTSIQSESKEVILSPLETLPEDLLNDTYTYAEVHDIDDPFKVYYISNRTGEAYATGRNIEIHVKSRNANTNATRKYTYENNRSINDNYEFEFVESTNGLSKVRIVYKGIQPPEVDFPEHPFPTINPDTLNSDKVGLWFDPLFDGQGFGINYIEDKDEFLVCWYTFATPSADDSKHQRWYIAQGKPNREMDVFEMYTNTTIAGREVIPAGKMSLSFTNDTRGKVRYIDAVGSRYDFNIVSLTPVLESNTINKLWYPPTQDGEGLQVFEWNGRMVAFWYTYGPTSRPPPFRPVDPTTAQRWYMYEGIKTSEGEYTGTLFEPVGGAFMHPKPVTLLTEKENVKISISGDVLEFSELPGIVFKPTF